MIHDSKQRHVGQAFWQHLGLAALFYFVITLALTWPVATHLRSVIFAQPGDPFGTLFSLWQSRSIWPTLTFPSAPFLVLTTTAFARLFGEVVSYNLILLSGFVLTGIAGYCLALRVTTNRLAAFFAGFVLMASPFHVSRALQHLGLANLQWLIFFVVSLLWFDEQPSNGRGTLVGLVFAVTMLDSYLYGLFALAVIAIFALWKLGSITLAVILDRKVRHWRTTPDQGSRLFGIFAATIVAIALTYPALRPLLAPTTGQLATTALTPSRSFDELTTYSAQWFAYGLPSPENPIYGRFTAAHYAQSARQTGSNLTELSLYLGWITVLLAVIGLFASSKTVHLRSVQFRYRSLFMLLALAGLYLSFAPTITIGSLTLPAPSGSLYRFIPFLRVYSRFALLALIGLVPLAAIGLTWILEQIPSRSLRATLAIALIGLSALELWALPTSHSVAVDAAHLPAEYQALPAGQPVYLAEYPLLPLDEPGGYDYLLWDRIHQARLLYRDLGDTSHAEERQALSNPTKPNVITALKARGVTYVMVHHAKYTPLMAVRHPFEAGTPPGPLTDPRLMLVGSYPDGTDLYQFR